MDNMQLAKTTAIYIPYKMKKGCSNLQPSQCGFQIFFIVLFYDQVLAKYHVLAFT